MNIATEIGQLVKKHRTGAGMTQLELSTKLGYDTPQFISLCERGASKVPVEVMGKLTVILGIPEKKFTEILLGEYKIKMQEKIAMGRDAAKAGA